MHLTTSVATTRKITVMTETWKQGSRDASPRTSLHGGEHGEQGTDREERQPRHILLGVSHVSDDLTQHRLFEIRAVYDREANGWVAQVAEQNRNEQPGAWTPELRTDGTGLNAFPSAAACLGDAVTRLVTLIDLEA
jgi:hypothetical protein